MRPREAAERWVKAIQGHDAGAVAACFAEDYEDEAPARRGEVVRGRAEVRANFERLFKTMPDLDARIQRAAEDGSSVWMEWSMHGTRPDGTRMEFVGVNVFEVDSRGLFRSGRIYTELVRDAGGLEGQVARMTE